MPGCFRPPTDFSVSRSLLGFGADLADHRLQALRAVELRQGLEGVHRQQHGARQGVDGILKLRTKGLVPLKRCGVRLFSFLVFFFGGVQRHPDIFERGVAYPPKGVVWVGGWKGGGGAQVLVGFLLVLL